MAQGMKNQPLFGGNMRVLIPAGAVDVSEIRQIPDNQEVYVHKATDQSIIIEILEMVSEPDDQAIRTHFNELASSNDAQDGGQISSVDPIPPNQIRIAECEHAYYLTGQQLVAKFKESAKNGVNMHMGLYRLPSKRTDIIVTFNDPVSISPQSSSGKGEAEAAGENVEYPAWTLEQFKLTVQSLTLQDSSFLG